MRSSERQHLGRRGETLAVEHFERLGYEVLARNHRTRFGELDLVLCDGRVLVFCEGKKRRLGSGAPWDRLDEAKRAQVRRMARAWLADVRDRSHCAELRFDAIGVTIDARGKLVRLDHEEAAF